MNAAQPYTSVDDAGSFPRGGAEEQIWEFLLRYAVRAPSGHNTQPWRFRSPTAAFTCTPTAAAHCPWSTPRTASW